MMWPNTHTYTYTHMYVCMYVYINSYIPDISCSYKLYGNLPSVLPCNSSIPTGIHVHPLRITTRVELADVVNAS